MNRHNETCEFCSELTQSASSTFEKAFREALPSRVVLRRHNFVAMPSFGQLVEGSLMFLPTTHVERFADMAEPDLIVAQTLIQHLRSRAWGPLLLFEHGAKAVTGGSCGIYHAHIHLIPVPTEHPELVSSLTCGLERSNLISLEEEWAGLERSDEYVLVDDGHSRWRVKITNTNRHLFPSQYFRRRLAVSLQSDRWDWRDYPQPEPAVTAAYHSWTTKLQTAQTSSL